MKVRIAIALIAAAGLRAQETPRSVWDGVYTAPQAERGKPLYNQRCGSCHGDSMSGGETAPPLAGGEFLSNWNGLTAGDLFDRIRTSMPMNAPGKLSREVNADITAYILRFNGFPAGAVELDRRSEVLKQIRIEPAKPIPASAPPNSQP